MTCLFVAICSTIFVLSSAGVYHGGVGHGSGSYNGGSIGNYAGHLSGGKAISEHISSGNQEEQQEQLHDYGENESSHQVEQESADEQHYEAEGGDDAKTLSDADDGHHYAGDYSSLATEGISSHKSDYSQHYDGHNEANDHYAGYPTAHYNEVDDSHHHQQQQHSYSPKISSSHDLGGHQYISGHHSDFYSSKPLIGIDHGKGSFSYSTTYGT